MGPYEYEVASIDGDYAVLRRTDNDTHDEILVARALLPEGSTSAPRCTTKCSPIPSFNI